MYYLGNRSWSALLFDLNVSPVSHSSPASQSHEIGDSLCQTNLSKGRWKKGKPFLWFRRWRKRPERLDISHPPNVKWEDGLCPILQSVASWATFLRKIRRSFWSSEKEKPPFSQEIRNKVAPIWVEVGAGSNHKRYATSNQPQGGFDSLSSCYSVFLACTPKLSFSEPPALRRLLMVSTLAPKGLYFGYAFLENLGDL